MTAPRKSLSAASEIKLKQVFQLGLEQGCPKDQLLNFSNAGLVLQAKQFAACAASGCPAEGAALRRRRRTRDASL